MFRFSFAILFFSTLSIGEKLRCSGPNFIQMGQSCVFIELFNSTASNFTHEIAEQKCNNLSSDFKWHLPKMDHSNNKDRLIVSAIFSITGKNSWEMWLGLRRDEPEEEDEDKNIYLWSDPSKWRWTIDESTLDQSYKEGLASPWFQGDEDGKPRNQPNNGEHIDAGRSGALELFVIAIYYPGHGVPRWYDVHEKFVPYIRFPQITDSVVVCESLLKKKSAEKKPFNFPWQWAMFGAAVGFFIASSTVLIIVVCRKCRKDRQSKREETKQRSTSCSESSDTTRFRSTRNRSPVSSMMFSNTTLKSQVTMKAGKSYVKRKPSCDVTWKKKMPASTPEKKSPAIGKISPAIGKKPTK